MRASFISRPDLLKVVPDLGEVGIQAIICGLVERITPFLSSVPLCLVDVTGQVLFPNGFILIVHRHLVGFRLSLGLCHTGIVSCLDGLHGLAVVDANQCILLLFLVPSRDLSYAPLGVVDETGSASLNVRLGNFDSRVHEEVLKVPVVNAIDGARDLLVFTDLNERQIKVLILLIIIA